MRKSHRKTTYRLQLATLGCTLIAAGWIPSANGTTAINLSITENSSTSLTAVLNGGSGPQPSVNNTSSDAWTITLPFSVQVGKNPAALFIPEPRDQTTWNEIVPASADSTSEFFISSDLFFPPAKAPAESSVVQDGTPVQIGIFATPDVSSTVLLTFHDLGDSQNVPEAASTLILLGLSFSGCVYFRRRDSGRILLS